MQIYKWNKQKCFLLCLLPIHLTPATGWRWLQLALKLARRLICFLHFSRILPESLSRQTSQHHHTHPSIFLSRVCQNFVVVWGNKKKRLFLSSLSIDTLSSRSYCAFSSSFSPVLIPLPAILRYLLDLRTPIYEIHSTPQYSFRISAIILVASPLSAPQLSSWFEFSIFRNHGDSVFFWREILPPPGAAGDLPSIRSFVKR